MATSGWKATLGGPARGGALGVVGPPTWKTSRGECCPPRLRHFPVPCFYFKFVQFIQVAHAFFDLVISAPRFLSFSLSNIPFTFTSASDIGQCNHKFGSTDKYPPQPHYALTIARTVLPLLGNPLNSKSLSSLFSLFSG